MAAEGDGHPRELHWVKDPDAPNPRLACKLLANAWRGYSHIARTIEEVTCACCLQELADDVERGLTCIHGEVRYCGDIGCPVHQNGPRRS